MAYDGRVYRILIASPSDVEEEREIAVKVIQEWNDLNSSNRQVVLLPLRWETHTAPEFGTRPQEIINRAIVDECDLLVGIFWTRLGSPTGAEDSGTLEEISRVGKAEKPIMLYFSKVEIDPDRIEVSQIEKLKKFKEQSYPKGLVETYKKHLEFRDKFSRQLELKVRDLQKSDSSGQNPLSLIFLSTDNGNNLGDTINVTSNKISMRHNIEIPKKFRSVVKDLVESEIREKSFAPVALAIENLSPLGIRNLFVELEISSDHPNVEIVDTLGTGGVWYSQAILSQFRLRSESELYKKIERTFSRFESQEFHKDDKAWRLSFEWEALQPQRLRLIKPVLFVSSKVGSELLILAKVYSDSFPEPLHLEAHVIVDVQNNSVDLLTLLPDWEASAEAVLRSRTMTFRDVVGVSSAEQSDP